MSYTMQITVSCDGLQQRRVSNSMTVSDPCRQQLVFKLQNESGLSPTYAADIAERKGWWARARGKGFSTPLLAFCPLHVPANGKEAAEMARRSSSMRAADRSASKPKKAQP